MNRLTQGFSDELIKLAGVLGSAAKWGIKHPFAALTAVTSVGAAGMEASRGYESGLRGGEKGQYLSATKNGPSEAFHTNYHPLFEHELSETGKRRLSRSFRPAAVKR